MSGSVTGALTLPYEQLDLAKRQGRIFNCPEENVTALVECLRGVSNDLEYGSFGLMRRLIADKLIRNYSNFQ